MATGTLAHACVLVLDDAPRWRHRIARLIYQRGYDTVEAGSSREAACLLKERPQEICAVVLSAAKRHAAFARVPVVMVPNGPHDVLKPGVSKELDTAIVQYCLEER